MDLLLEKIAKEESKSGASKVLGPKKVLGSEFLGYLTGGNIKQLQQREDALISASERVRRGVTASAGGRFQSAKVREALKQGTLSQEDMRLMRLVGKPDTNLSPAQKIRQKELKKQFGIGVIEKIKRAFTGKSRADKIAAESAKPLAEISQKLIEETDKVRKARTKAGMGLAIAGAVPAAAYVYKKKRDAKKAAQGTMYA